ncbi:uncharacterized protein LOC110248305 isoform X3 [Exaiptasia diaphana]|uniref:FAD dependent oxidoreductase domain-containing protein n=1 Tax=Exaiptasia diaphana TaxID=2652724 RepID=A0A913YRE3_EXADI|nr:uncharacterized protein LOC110248305 isoform X3 [Exaiptasia diaphana]
MTTPLKLQILPLRFVLRDIRVVHRYTKNMADLSGVKKERVLVVGAGVIGLTTALTLAEHGYRVRILAREFVACDDKSKLTSQVAAAFWGINTSPGCEEKKKNWCLYSYKKFVKLAENPQKTGVFIRELLFVYPHLIDMDPHTKETKSNFQKYLPGNPLRHDKNLLREKGLSLESGLQDAMSIHVPVIETDMFMYWLTQQCISKGIDFIQGTVDFLLENCDSLRRTQRADCIVNCTGLSARNLVQDHNVYPRLGVGLTLRNGDRMFPVPENCAIRGKIWYQDGAKAGEVAIVPRVP